VTRCDGAEGTEQTWCSGSRGLLPAASPAVPGTEEPALRAGCTRCRGRGLTYWRELNTRPWRGVAFQAGSPLLSNVTRREGGQRTDAISATPRPRTTRTRQRPNRRLGAFARVPCVSRRASWLVRKNQRSSVGDLTSPFLVLARSDPGCKRGAGARRGCRGTGSHAAWLARAAGSGSVPCVAAMPRGKGLGRREKRGVLLGRGGRGPASPLRLRPAGWPRGSLSVPGEALPGCLRPLAFPRAGQEPGRVPALARLLVGTVQLLGKSKTTGRWQPPAPVTLLSHTSLLLSAHHNLPVVPGATILPSKGTPGLRTGRWRCRTPRRPRWVSPRSLGVFPSTAAVPCPREGVASSPRVIALEWFFQTLMARGLSW